MANGRVSIRSVAAAAGVAIGTVSKALNGDREISEATRARVLQAARELGYVPDAAARTLATGRTDTLGLVICRAEHLRVDAFVPQALHGVYRVARERGFKVVVEALEDPDQPDALRRGTGANPCLRPRPTAASAARGGPSRSQVPALISAAARAISSSIVRRSSASGRAIPAASRSAFTLRSTSSSPASWKSEATTVLA